jgi:hypothetical protein
MFCTLSRSGELLVVHQRTAHEELLVLCARIGYRP